MGRFQRKPETNFNQASDQMRNEQFRQIPNIKNGEDIIASWIYDTAMYDRKAESVEKYKIAGEERGVLQDIAKEGRTQDRVIAKEGRDLERDIDKEGRADERVIAKEGRAEEVNIRSEARALAKGKTLAEFKQELAIKGKAYDRIADEEFKKQKEEEEQIEYELNPDTIKSKTITNKLNEGAAKTNYYNRGRTARPDDMSDFDKKEYDRYESVMEDVLASPEAKEEAERKLQEIGRKYTSGGKPASGGTGETIAERMARLNGTR